MNMPDELFQVNRMIREIIEHDEGGWQVTLTDNDRGGLTIAGLSERVWRHYNDNLLGAFQVRINPGHSFTERQQDAVIAIYRMHFYHDTKLPIILNESWQTSVVHMLLSMAIVAGYRGMTKCLQRTIRDLHDDTLVVDGLFGPMTTNTCLEMTDGGYDDAIMDTFVAHCQRRFIRIARSDPSQLVFLEGWFNRMEYYRREVWEG